MGLCGVLFADILLVCHKRLRGSVVSLAKGPRLSTVTTQADCDKLRPVVIFTRR